MKGKRSAHATTETPAERYSQYEVLRGLHVLRFQTLARTSIGLAQNAAAEVADTLPPVRTQVAWQHVPGFAFMAKQWASCSRWSGGV